MMKKLRFLLVFAFLFVGSSMLLAQIVVKAELDGGQEDPKNHQCGYRRRYL